MGYVEFNEMTKFGCSMRRFGRACDAMRSERISSGGISEKNERELSIRSRSIGFRWELFFVLRRVAALMADHTCVLCL